MKTYGSVLFAIALLITSIAPLCAQAGWDASENKCVILDGNPKPIYEMGFHYIPGSEITMPDGELGPFGSTSGMELGFDWNFAYYRDVWFGDIDLTLSTLLTIYDAPTRVEMPNQLARISLEMEWTTRFAQGYGMIFDFHPGAYADLEQADGSILYFPLSLSAVKSLGKDVSVQLGAELRPNFDRIVMPVVGLVWEPSNAARIELMLPESRIEWYMGDDWMGHIGFAWNSTTYSLREKSPYDREDITIEDYRAFFGVSCLMHDQVTLTAEVGSVFERTVEFGQPFNLDFDPVEGELEMEDAFYAGLRLIGPL
jgi:hypothetical protein